MWKHRIQRDAGFNVSAASRIVGLLAKLSTARSHCIHFNLITCSMSVTLYKQTKRWSPLVAPEYKNKNSYAQICELFFQLTSAGLRTKKKVLMGEVVTIERKPCPFISAHLRPCRRIRGLQRVCGDPQHIYQSEQETHQYAELHWSRMTAILITCSVPSCRPLSQTNIRRQETCSKGHLH